MNARHFLSALPVLGILWGCGSDVAGTNDETHTESLARVYLPDGNTPAAGALVQVVPRDGVTASATGNVNANGQAVLPRLADGTYSVTVSQGSLSLIVDSLSAVGGTLQWSRSDTLEPSATLGGIVKVEPQDDPARVTVNVLGTEIWANVGHDGRFRLTGLGTGRLRLRFQTTDSGYVTTYDTARVRVPGALDSLADTVRMTYVGIPVVQGLKVTNDPATGNLTLRWPKVAYGQLLDYAVLRDTAGSLVYGTVPMAATTDTFWTDTTASRRLDPASWRYRVLVRTKGSSAAGSWTEAVTATSLPPWLQALDSLTWTERVRTAPGFLGAIGASVAVAHPRMDEDSVRIGLRSSSDGLVWDSTTLLLPRYRSGQAIRWTFGYGVGSFWAFGHSELGDGVYAFQSLGGSKWDSIRVLDDTLWPARLDSDSLRVEGDSARVVLSSPTSGKLVWSADGKTWVRRNLAGGPLGVTAGGLLSTGGGLHLLELGWSGTVKDLGTWTDPVTPTRAMLWNGRPAVLASERLWLGGSSWTLRRGAGLVQLAVVAGRLVVQDAQGRVWEGK